MHTWSLSVEEQFYLFYPIFLYVSFSFFKSYIKPIVTITVLSFAFFVYYTYIANDVDISFYLLPSRIWELSIGGLCGIVSLPNKSKSIEKYLPVIGVFFIFISFLIGSRTLWVLPVIGSAFIILFIKDTHWLSNILTSRIFVFIGKISYSLYLWHWCIIVLFNNLGYQFRVLNHHLLNLIIIGCTFLLAILSYYYIENKTRNYVHTPKIVLLGGGVIIGFVCFFQSNTYSQYYDNYYDKQVNYMRYYDLSPSLNGLDDFLSQNSLAFNFDFPERLPMFDKAYSMQGIVSNTTLGTPKIMLIGDSHGVMWAKLIDDIANEHSLAYCAYTSNGSKPFINIRQIHKQEANKYYTKQQRVLYAKSLINNIDTWKPKLVVIVCRWAQDKKLEELLSYLGRKNIRVLLFTQPPVIHYMHNQNAGQYFTYLGLRPKQGYNYLQLQHSTVNNTNDYIKALPAHYKHVYVYDVFAQMVKPNNQVMISKNKEVFYFDDDHLSFAGTMIHKKNINNIVRTLLNQ